MEILNIEKLNFNNFGTWEKDVQVLLLERNCLNIVLGKEQPPDVKIVKYKEIKDYEARKAKSYSTIYLTLEPELRPLIANTIDSSEAWQIILKFFKPDSRARVIELTHSFFSCKPNEDEKIALYAARLQRLMEELKGLGKPIADWYSAFQLIRYLPNKYDQIVQTIYRWGDEDFVFQKVLKELIEEEGRLHQKESDNSEVVLKSTAKCNSCMRETKDQKRSQKVRRYFRTSKNKRNICNVLEESNYVDYNNTKWIFDSAASSHFCNDRSLFINFKKISNSKLNTAIKGISCKIEGVGDVKLQFKEGKRIRTVKLKNVKYTPRLKNNLIAGSVIDKEGGSFKCKGGKLRVYDKDENTLFSANRQDGLYYVSPLKTEKVKNKALYIKDDDDAMKWHRKYNHINFRYIKDTSSNNLVKGLPTFKNNEINCEICKVAKTRRKTFKALNNVRSKKPLELLHMDVCGPLPTTSREGHKYFLTITDDYSRKVTIYPLKQKSDVLQTFTRFQTRVERLLGTKIINIRTDNGLEFINNDFAKLLNEQGINAERTNIYTPEQNGVSERLNYTALDAVKAMLQDSKLPPSFWAEALLCFSYTWNRVCHQGQSKTPFELFYGNKPSVRHLQIFGTEVYIGTPYHLRNKLQNRAKKGIFIGYALQTRGYRVWLPNERKVIETANVRFAEYKNNVEGVLDPVYKTFDSIYNDNDFVGNENTHIIKFTKSSSSSDSDSESSESQSSSERESESSEHSDLQQEIRWYRKAVPRKDESRTDIYYYPENTKSRLRSIYDVKKYCKSHNINYNPTLFNFSGKYKYSGIVDEDNVNNIFKEEENFSA